MKEDTDFFWVGPVDTGQNGRHAKGSHFIEPDEVIQPGAHLPADEHLGWQLEHKMIQTSGQQASHLIQVYRQAELDQFRADRAMWVRIETIKVAIDYAEQVCDLRDRYTGKHPEVAGMFQLMAASALYDFQQIPRAAMGLFLQRYGLG